MVSVRGMQIAQRKGGRDGRRTARKTGGTPMSAPLSTADER